MPALKNLRHESFVREYLKRGVGADAYQRAYPRAARNTAGRNAWYLLNRNTKVPARLTELRQEVLKKSDITIERVLTDCEEAKQIAKEQRRPRDIINAVTAQAKLVGLFKDQGENTASINESDDIDQILRKVSDECGPQAAQAFAKAVGLITEKSSD